jgi:hypothetical protein
MPDNVTDLWRLERVIDGDGNSTEFQHSEDPQQIFGAAPHAEYNAVAAPNSLIL